MGDTTIGEDPLDYIKEELEKQGFDNSLIAKIQIDSNGIIKYVGASIGISSAEDIYALSRILQIDEVKNNFIKKDTTYDINEDYNKFQYPEGISTNDEKREYLQSASYILLNDIELIIQKVENKNYFTGIGSSKYPFQGTFNGNDKTITLSANDSLNLKNISDYGTGVFDVIKDSKISNLNINVNNDIVITSQSGGACIGAVAGSASTTEFSDCKVVISNAVLGANYNETVSSATSIGGIVGESSFSIYRNCNVIMKNSSLIGKATDVTATRKYGVVTVGGIVGFSKAGSDNSENIGRLGNQLYNCSFIAENDNKDDVIIASIESGNEVTAGGIVGCTFNNLLVKGCKTEVKNGNISATKGGTEDNADFGAQVGGIVGRLEHTGEVSDCHVKGDNLTLLSKSPNNITSAGGIVGADVGPIHRDIDTINKCSFNGTNTSNIQVEITSTGTLEKSHVIAAGGIVGNGSYIISDCSVKDTTITNKSSGVGNPTTYAGKIAGYIAVSKVSDVSGVEYGWIYGTYFKPREPGIFSCEASGITFDVSDNVTVSDY